MFNFIIYKTTPNVERVGISMSKVEAEGSSDAAVSEFVFVHSPEYRATQQEFWDAVESLDPNQIIVHTYYSIELY